MFFRNLKIVVYVTFTITPMILTYILSKRYRKLIESYYPNNNGNYKIICTMYHANRECRAHIFKRTACSENCSYNYLTIIERFIETARHSISLCMCITTVNNIQDALIRAHKRGVQVRLITDFEMLRTIAARTEFLKDAGIPIKMSQGATTILHHKFCLADENYPSNAKLFFGTLNLTLQALTSNWEVIVFTKDPNVIPSFREEFEYLWTILNDF